MAGKFYAVKKGRKPGIYMSWDACKAQVMGFPKARYKTPPKTGKDKIGTNQIIL